MLEVFVTNLGKYNEGTLVGKWLELPTDNGEIEDTLKKIGIDGEEYEEYFISDYEFEKNNFFEIREYSDVYELNNKMSEIKELNETELKVLEILVNSEGLDLEQAMANLDEVRIYEENNLYEIGSAMLKSEREIPDFLDCYIDYEGYAKNCDIQCYGGTYYSLYF